MFEWDEETKEIGNPEARTSLAYIQANVPRYRTGSHQWPTAKELAAAPSPRTTGASTKNEAEPDAKASWESSLSCSEDYLGMVPYGKAGGHGWSRSDRRLAYGSGYA
ncbi:hypothetical protein MGG_15729 [Pyricularia oryzae 70-15]|uniref:Uncharacterized protein n=3 Tax=Pyricularia oryzae TaxID=318829 RepID=G4MTE6_PYRO7|nr:uncharacterized protein MGG_15729 [Pyricularia oryzae 70-15]EHA54697.1 hypothetical protein MGG_15729 [Pyricularia oryzae 70-15]ELQ37455.1 hypothetical protein OOU_Y34scaffold00592g3 [Pyricularia oryzae Y34]